MNNRHETRRRSADRAENRIAIITVTVVVCFMAIAVNFKVGSLKKKEAYYQQKEEVLTEQVAAEEERSDALKQYRIYIQTKEYIDEVLSNFGKDDFLILQNEVNLLDYIIDRGYERGMKIVLNPSPFDEKIAVCDLSKVYLFLLNEIEGEQFTGFSDKDQILTALVKKFPASRFVLTLGSEGALYYDGKEKIFQDIFPVKAVDTTAAGDTFTGFFVAALLEGISIKEALRIAAKASSIAVSRPGAAPSIPCIQEVKRALSLTK